MILVSDARRAEYLAAGWWGTATLFDHFAANVAARPDAEAVIDAPNREEFAHGLPARWTWSQLADQVDRFSILLMEAGIRRDDIVIMQLPNVVDSAKPQDLKQFLPAFLEDAFKQWAETETREIAMQLEQLAEKTVALVHEDARDSAKRVASVLGADARRPHALQGPAE